MPPLLLNGVIKDFWRGIAGERTTIVHYLSDGFRTIDYHEILFQDEFENSPATISLRHCLKRSISVIGWIFSGSKHRADKCIFTALLCPCAEGGITRDKPLLCA